MFWHINTIGKRLFLAFSILAVNVIIISALSYHYLSSNKAIYEHAKKIESERTQILRLLKVDLDFLRFEVINEEFYRTSRSSLLEQRDSLYHLILAETKDLQYASDQDLGVQHHFDSIGQMLRKYNATFLRIKERIVYRGFKDYGVEGGMRKFAHELERHRQDITMVEVLSLRRHEKDYFLRKEQQYKRRFNHLADSLLLKLTQPAGSRFVAHLLASYKENFNQLATLDEEIGLTPTKGLQGELNTLNTRISDHLANTVEQSYRRADAVIHQGLVSYILIGIGTVVVSFVLTYATALRLARPIKRLSSSISRYMVTQGLDETELDEAADTNEIGNLAGAFIKMTRKLKTQFDEIQRKSQLLEKRNAELNRLNEELDRFIYSSAHDLKSPLASMAGLVHLAEREMNVPEHTHYFDKMRSSIEKMEGFIRDITDYAKNKRQQISADKIDVQSIVADIFQSLQFIPHADTIEKIVEIGAGEFYTDKTRLEIILKNLLSNAIRYADRSKSQPFIRLSIDLQKDHGVIRIEDNGIGIGEEHLHRIFEMFYRASDNAKGSGIGLFLVRESVKMLRGTITVESATDKGTTFILNLPNLKRVNVNQLPESEPIKFLTAS